MENNMSELIKKLMESTHAYTIRRISSTDDKETYTNVMRKCYRLCDVHNGNATAILADMRQMQDNAATMFNWKDKIFSNVQRYYALALRQAIEVVESLQDRFDPNHDQSSALNSRNPRYQQTRTFFEPYENHLQFMVWNVDENGCKLGISPLVSLNEDEMKVLASHLDQFQKVLDKATGK